MVHNRRDFIKTFGYLSLLPLIPIPLFGKLGRGDLIPPRLEPGQVVGLINPAGATFHPDDVTLTEETLLGLGLGVKRGKHLLDRHGYLAGTDQARADDINLMFADPEVDAILTVRGGWGCNRLLHLIDYDLIKKNPKIIVGYSDITSLLIAIYARTGLITFHGPVGVSTWNEFTVDYFKRLLFDGEALTMKNPVDKNYLGVQADDRIQVINPGVAEGRLVGGNLSVLAAMIGSDYLPDWKNKFLFVEEVGEDIYRVDRMLTQLKLAGVLDQLKGFIFGNCTKCGPGKSYSSLTLEEVLEDHIKPLNVPSWYGAMIGHIEDKFTVPVGAEAKIDAEAGTITLLGPVVH